jgi:uncharacterized phage infection (PIP) family protein YhgE
VNTAVAINRTPDLIAAEINHIKDQTRRIALYNAIEIGRRLTEAKMMLPHGEWGKWLTVSVDYSQSTAQNLIRIFEEYGSEQLTILGGDNAKSQALGSLNYTQAVALLCLPENEREKFVEEHDMERISTRELQKALKERDQALEDKKTAEQQRADANRIADEKANEAKTLQDQLDQAKEASKREAEKLQGSIEDIRKQLENAKASGEEDEVERLKLNLEEADNQLLSANEEIAELNRQLSAKPIDVQATIEKIPEDVQKELDDLRRLRDTQQQSLAIPIFEVHFKTLVDDFRSLLGTLAQIECETKPEEYDRYKHATLELISQMSARV